MKPNEKLAIRHLPCDQFMTTNVECVKFAMPVRDIIEILLRRNVSGAPVVDHVNRLVSVVSQSDLIKFAIAGGLSEPLQKFQSKLVPEKNVITVRQSTPFGEVFKKFLEHKVRRLIVVDDNGKVLGLVAKGDMLRAMIENESKSSEYELNVSVKTSNNRAG